MKKNNMDVKYFFAGLALFIVGLLMLNDVRKRKPASEETNGEGQLLPQYIQFWGIAILSTIVGLILIIESV